MSLKVYFLRHGETEYSLTGGYCGIIDAELTPEGHAMAHAFASAYKTLPWEAVYVSPMRRTLATAQPLCEAIKLSPYLREGLREISYGDWEGREQKDVKSNDHDTYVRWLTEPAWNAPSHGETAVQVASRAMPVITEIENTHPTGNVLVVSHKATIRIMICSLLGIDLGRYRDRIDAPAASLSVIQFGEHGPMLQRLGDRSFMSSHLQERSGT